MTKLTQKHYDALVRAETGLIRLYDPSTTARVRHEFENDMRLLAELKKFVMFLIYSPELPHGPGN